MAGGSGTRFWPLSRKESPKQLLNIVGGDSMLQMTVDRLRKVKFVDDIFIVTRSDLANKITETIEGIPKENIIIEPSGKNTAPCIGLSALRLEMLKKDSVMGVFPADHLIVGHQKFQKALKTANHLVQKKHSIAAIGIKPTYPSTAYGYIQYNKDEVAGQADTYHLKTFAEKPHLNLAKRFMQSGDFLWNSGIFIWRANVLLDLMKVHIPDLYKQLIKMKPILKKNQDISYLWESITPESIDYGLMEKVGSDAYVIKADFKWNDLGSWNALYDILPKNKEGNVVRGEGMILNGKDNFIYSQDHFTAVVGLENVVTVHTDDVTLVVHKDQVEEVKSMVGLIAGSNRENLL
ncbi:MAG TPA: mannose-1-phosphate guanylyltransferase [Candidatus Marinimicrobia bacterium]|jgi:mannose-1-phosphate guanylyltransferase|nr:mannose-1-phosphate guanylyltransferase [Candidatus Neomarinimicrobiota bacterium]|tara:strand:- start:3947 stop:4993 length:1047 start_codon:yes stop_codon:yes gene_type:complete